MSHYSHHTVRYLIWQAFYLWWEVYPLWCWSCWVCGLIFKGIVNYELLDNNQTIKYLLQSTSSFENSFGLKKSSLVNRNGVNLNHDNARPHTIQLTKIHLEEVGWEKLLHPHYSDLVPSDYHLTITESFWWSWVDIKSKGCTRVCDSLQQNLKNFSSMASISLLTDGMQLLESNCSYVNG